MALLFRWRLYQLESNRCVQRRILDRTDPLCVTDSELLRRYRFPRPTIIELIGIVKSEIEPVTKRSNSLPAVLQVCITLNFYATCCLYSNLQLSFGVSIASISRILHKVSRVFIAKLLPDSVTFPDDIQQEVSAQRFLELAGFPNVIGCLDGTQIAIKSPSENEHVFVNRKGFHSLNVIAVCDAEMMFRNVVAKYPGSCLKCRFKNGEFGDKWLLGDSGFALGPYLLTPFLHPETAGEREYNRAHRKTRVQIERAFGILKSRFLCLSHKVSGPLSFSPAKCCAILTVCFCLHNRARRLRLPDPDNIDVENFTEDDFDETPADPNVGVNAQTRRRVVRHYFD